MQTPSIHVLANPNRFLRFSTPTMWIAFVIAIPVCWVAAVWGLFFAPADYQQGDSVRIMYVHAPSAWMAMFAYACMAVASATNLIWRHPVAGLAARAAAGPGIVFAAVTLLTGSIWGKPTWGAWWVWDARLTSMLILFFIYAGYLALWRTIGDPQRAMRPAAIFCLVGAIILPIIKYSVDWWSTLHQPASVFRFDGPTIHPSMLYPLLLMGAGFVATFIGSWMLATRTHIRRARILAIRSRAGGMA